MKIVLLDNDTLKVEGVKQDLSEFGTVEVYHSTNQEELHDRISDTEIILTNKVVIDQEAISKAPKLKLISILATGMNNVDVDFAAKSGVSVNNVSGYSTNSVAQHTFTCLFALLGQIEYYDNYVKNGQYSQSEMFTHLASFFTEINGKKFGIIGLGNIGKKVAEIATAFGAEVCYFSTSGRNNNNEYSQVGLDKMLNECDIISIHAPLNDDTIDLITKNELVKMKSNAILINMGRGGIVNEVDLARALDDNIISGACLDVFQKEPFSKESSLLKKSISHKLILTPHIAWASVQAREDLWQKTLENIRNFLKNQ